MPASLRKEVAEHGWEIAGAEAYPCLAVIAEGSLARPPTADEMTVAEAISLSLAEVLADERPLRAAFDRGEPLARTLRVKTHAGELEVTLRAPYVARASGSVPLLGEVEGKPLLAAVALPPSSASRPERPAPRARNDLRGAARRSRRKSR